MKKLSCTVDSKYLDMLWTGSYIYTTYDHPGITTVSYKTIAFILAKMEPKQSYM